MTVVKWIAFLLPIIALALPAAASPPAKPNILVIYLDDMGFGDPGCYGGKLAPTPNIDSFAQHGIRCTDGYVSACICAPSRAGLMTGCYQARFGFDSNGGNLTLKTTLMSQRLKEAGYVTGIVGKWHLGSDHEFLPAARGFDFSIGSIGNLGENKGAAFYRDYELMNDLPGAPITSPIYAREACDFIERNRTQPWFLYLAFNAVHNPNVASEEVLARFAKLSRHERDYAASISEADDSIGVVLQKLRDLQLEENTLIFCISDNGDSSPFANREGLRGHKWLLWEGGVREPWLVQWKAVLPQGRVMTTPVIQLDVLPTALAAAGVEPKPDWQLDGVNLLPLLSGKVDHLARDTFYWRFGPQFAVRHGEWKLVTANRGVPPILVNLAHDRGEQNDLSLQEPEKLRELQGLWDAWNAQMPAATDLNNPNTFGEERKEHKQEQRKRKKVRQSNKTKDPGSTGATPTAPAPRD